MKILISLFLILSSFGLSAQSEMPEIRFSSTEIDYGKVVKNSSGYRQLTVTNTGKAPLIINQCTASCGCTVPTCPQSAIAPGKTEPMTIRYNTERIGPFSKNVTVYSNDPQNPMSIIRIFGEVTEE